MAETHAQVLKTLGVTVAAVCGRPGSVRAKAFAQRHQVARLYDRWEELAADPRLEALWVAASWDEMEKLLIPLLATQKHLFLEKPVALHSAVLWQALALAKNTGNKVAVGMNRRFYDFLGTLRRFLNEHPLKSVEVILPEQVERDADAPWFIRSIHELDLIYHLLGPLKVETMVQTDSPSRGVHGFHGLLVTERSGIPVHLIAPWGSPWNKAIRFFFEEDVVELCPIEEMRIFHGMAEYPATPENPVARFKPALAHEERVSTAYKPGLYGEDEKAVIWMRGEGDPGELATLEDALKVTCLIETIRRAGNLRPVWLTDSPL